jgi:hypothetical protein
MHNPIDCREVAARVGAPAGWVPNAEASVVPDVSGDDGGTAPGGPAVPGTGIPGLWPSRIGADTRGLPIEPPGGGAGGDAGPLGTGPMRAAILGVRRTASGTWWAVVKLGRPMGVGGRVDRLRSGRAPRLVRGLKPQPVDGGTHRVRLGTLRGASYRVTLTCRSAGLGTLVVRRAFKVPAARPGR